MSDEAIQLLNQKLDRLTQVLEQHFDLNTRTNDLTAANAFVWQAETSWLQPVPKVNRVELDLLKGIDNVRDILIDNTERFANSYAANNALLWGARGMGKSSLVKAAHANVLKSIPQSNLKLIEIHREDIDSLPALLGILRDEDCKAIL